MKIQLITNNPDLYEYNFTKISSINEPSAFDMFDINILDLSYKDIWKNNGGVINTINIIEDFDSIQRIIESSQQSYIIIVLPQNIRYIYQSYREHGRVLYKNGKQIKDILDEFTSLILSRLLNLDSYGELLYENSINKLSGEEYKSSFVFDRVNVVSESLSVSEGNKKTTVLKKDKTIITTLDIFESTESIIKFLIGIGLSEDKEPIPDWIKDHDILDDKEQKAIISEKKAQIEEAKQAIQSAEDKLNENLEFKSILFENSNSLVKHVFSILEEILSCNLSNFVDVKKEDFLINLPNITFIGEIKGISSNVKSSNVSQIDVRYQEYLEKLKEDEKEENVKQLLIINHQRQKPLHDREPVNEEQITIAVRNGNLIIETSILLEVFIKFRTGEIDTEKIIEVFSTKTGLLNMEAFD